MDELKKPKLPPHPVKKEKDKPLPSLSDRKKMIIYAALLRPKHEDLWKE